MEKLCRKTRDANNSECEPAPFFKSYQPQLELVQHNAYLLKLQKIDSCEHSSSKFTFEYLSRSLAYTVKHLLSDLWVQFCSRQGKTDACNKLSIDSLKSTLGFQGTMYKKLHQKAHTVHQRMWMTANAARDWMTSHLAAISLENKGLNKKTSKDLWF